MTRQVRREAGVGFDAVQSVAIHLGPLADLPPRVDCSDTATTTLERRWWRVGVRPEQHRRFHEVQLITVFAVKTDSAATAVFG